MSDKLVTIEGKKLKLTNLDKELWPGINKLALIDYFGKMANYILPYLKDRPLSMHRFPDGIKGKSFFQKNIGEIKLPWMETKKIKNDEDGEVVEYLVCNNKATLIYLANLACLELHPWLSKIDNLTQPDFLVLDLDPEDIDFSEVINVARAAKKILDKLSINGFVKTSGARGLHLFLNVGGKYSYKQVREFAKILAHLINKEVPEITSLERLPEKRQKKVYIDYLQNAEGQTIVAPYSTRPIEKAPVSTPLAWGEIKEGLSPVDFTIKNIQERVIKRGDLFSQLLDERAIDIKKTLAKIS